jgi:hypothetical protein
VLALAGVVAVSAAPQAAETQHPQGQDPQLRREVQSLHADRRHQRTRPNSPFALGDEIVFHDQLFADGKRVGDDLGSCQELAANCSLVIPLPEGNLTGQFVAVQGRAPREIALTGGTGRYRSAGGEGPWSSSATAKDA